MARIPVYNRQMSTPVGVNAPRQQIASSPDAFGAAQGKTLSRTGQMLDEVSSVLAKGVSEFRKKSDNAALNNAVAEYLKWDLDYNENEIFSKKGKDANVEVLKKAKEEHLKKLNELAQTMRTPELGDMLKTRLMGNYVSSQKIAARHIKQESDKWALLSAKDAADAQFNSLVLKARSLSGLEAEENFDQFMLPLLKDFAKISGKPEGEVVRPIRENYYNLIIDHALKSGDIERAKTLKEKWDKDLSVKKSTALTTAIHEKEAKLNGQLLAEKLFNDPGVSYTEAQKIINDVKDDLERRTARAMFNNYRTVQKNMETAQYQTGVDQAYQKLDSLAGDLLEQQKMVDDLPANTPIERKIKTKAESYLARFKAAKGLKPKTDLQAYDDAVQGIISGKYNTLEEIKAEFGDKIEAEDIKNDLGGMLKEAQKVTTSSLNTAYSFAVGSNGNPKVKLSNAEKKDRGAFVRWAQAQVRETNRAQDPDYFQKLADLWVLKGRWTRDEHWWTNDDLTFGQVVKKGEERYWIHPDAERLFNEESIEVQYAWRHKYEGDMDKILAEYSQKLIQLNIGPRSK